MSRTVRIDGLPDFGGDATSGFRITKFDGWWNAATPDAVMVANGGGPGVVASGPWLPAEAYYGLTGYMEAPPPDLEALRDALLTALPSNRDVPITVLGNGLALDKQAFVRRYDKPEILLGARVDFTVPLVAADPYKYGTVLVGGNMGVWTGQRWYRTYGHPATPWTRVYLNDGTGRWVRTYVQAADVGAYPSSVTVNSASTVTSRRVVARITGPLTAGQWWIVNEATGRRMWVNITLSGTQQLVVDTVNLTAVVGGSDVSHLVYGDWLTLEPGPNLYRLISGSQSSAWASIEALEAFE
jgi:hypothetical protein